MKYSPNGICTAIVTPLTPSDELDELALRRLIDYQIEAGIQGLLVIGGSGEYVSLSAAERQRVVEVAVEHAADRVPVVAGALAPGSREVCDTARLAEAAGASAVLVLPPYYIRPSARGVIEHFKRVADSVSLPIVAYNNVARTGANLDIPALEKLAEIPSIVALKECDRDLGVVATKIRALRGRMAVLAGDDDLGFPTFLLGSPGGIFTTSNIAPAVHRQMFDACMRGDIETARSLHYALLPLIEAVYTANHPGPLKDAMSLIGHPVGSARAPLQGATQDSIARATAALKGLKEALG